MGFIGDELHDVSKLCEHAVAGSRVVCCVPAMVRVEISRTLTKHIVVCIQFPSDYPASPLLIELKSKTLSLKLLEKLNNVCECKAKALVGKPQVLSVLKFIRHFIDENPLSCCYDEISAIKKVLSGKDEIKLKQKDSSLRLHLGQGLYFFRTLVKVPDNYPEAPISLQDPETNFPALFERYFLGQAKEIARKCIEPPVSTKKRNNGKFKAQPSLQAVVSFLVSAVKQIPKDECQLCHEQALPLDPEEAERDETADAHVERLYCGHLFHQQCLITYMKTPPFQGKKCLKCSQPVYHEKWRVSERVAEERWNHEKARERELKEVAEFLFE